MTWNKKFSHRSQLHKKLGFLKLHDVYKLELAKFMHKLFKNKLPKLCNYNFTKLTKFMIMQLENQADLITFYLESLNLLDKIKSNLDALNYGKKLVKLEQINPSILLKSSLKKIYCEITDHAVRH